MSTLARKKKSPYRQPNSLPKSQFNLATLLLCYKMNNCLWVHSQAHYCFYITSKNLRQAKDIALLIVLRNSAFPCGKESVLEAHLEDRSPSLAENCLQLVYLHVSAEPLWCSLLGILKSVIWMEDSFLFLATRLFRSLTSDLKSKCWDAFSRSEGKSRCYQKWHGSYSSLPEPGIKSIGIMWGWSPRWKSDNVRSQGVLHKEFVFGFLKRGPVRRIHLFEHELFLSPATEHTS